MEALRQRILSHPYYDKALYWFKTISITGLAQIIVQGVGFVTGILIIRLLPTQEYALYTLANTMLGTMTVLADGGISSGVMAQGGKVWQDREKLGVVLATGLDLRRKFAVGSLIVSTPILFYLLLHHGASWMTSILIVMSLIPAFYAAISDSLLEMVPKLNQSIFPLQKNQVGVGIGRLVLTGLTLFVFPWTFVAIWASGIPRIYGNIQLRKIAYGFTDRQQLDPVIRKEILSMVRRILPGSIYYCLSGQIALWLISILGNTTSVAQLGALGRFAMLLTLLNVWVGTLIIPRFARLSEKKKVLLERFFQIFILLFFVLLIIVALVYLFSDSILWILGKNYIGLQNELILSIIGSCIGLLAGVAFSLFTSRGWVINPVFSIFLSLLSIVVGALIFNMSSLQGVLLYNIYLSFFQLLINGGYCLYKIKTTI
ncbi:polysaccharide biosynthesis protein [Paludibacter jiangxiensis]|uniref:Membrane protein n=1 Tax=Paludibacter jiangxiensis TaxID=681398 RepID=A0A161LVF9_9BACT|nr:polysaccharide biosynthesis protein [Paludibacter jiangxiensis]GAT63249.1 membrane protein [Paludibacter jiangxiensis]